jgi:hypothetical protein
MTGTISSLGCFYSATSGRFEVSSSAALLRTSEMAKPLAFERVCHQLSLLLDRRKLECKAHLREFNIEMGRRSRLKAMQKLASAFWASPTSFVRRVLDEFHPPRIISLGEPSAFFAQHRDTLWVVDKETAEAVGSARSVPQVDCLAAGMGAVVHARD